MTAGDGATEAFLAFDGMDCVGFEESIGELRKTFNGGRTKDRDWRKSQLEGLRKLLRDKDKEIFVALKQDLGKSPTESYRDEVGVVIKSLNLALSSLDKWMAIKRVSIPLLFFPATGEVMPEPLGVVLIFSCWNFPIGLSLEPLIGAIAAGNAVLLKPSEMAPACSSFLAKYIPKYMDVEAVKVIEGGPTQGQHLLEYRWDTIFFTGSQQVGRIIMTAAAKHLTPVILELGGKCPAIVDTLTTLQEIKVTSNKIVGGKWGLCNGQACIAIDYLLVEEKFAPNLLNQLKRSIKKICGENPKESANISKIINEKHFMRLRSLLQDPAVAASIVHGGSVDDDNLFIEPTILLDPPLGAEIMTEEIFGPLLPIITLKNIQESIEFIKSRPKALAIYVFTKDETLKKRVLYETSSGSVTFNDAIVQFVCDSLPFGGVGQSGFGKYHGKFSFDAFSNSKAVLRRNFLDFYFRYPPWDALKFRLIQAVYDFDYLGLLLLMLGLKK